MKSGFNSKRIKPGKSFKTSRSRINYNAPDIKHKNTQTSNGWVTFVFLWLLWICIFLIAYFKHNSDYSYPQIIKNAIAISSGIDFGLCLLWFSGRSMIFSHLSYVLYKMSEAMKLRPLKRRLKLSMDDKLFDNMDSYEEYYEYLELRKQNSKLAFYVTFFVFLLVFIISLIVALS